MRDLSGREIKQCSICKHRWHCPVDANGHTPCESGYKYLADDKDEAKFLSESYQDYLAEYFEPYK